VFRVRFNSTLVRFKHSKNLRTDLNNNSFNSTLVRFKHENLPVLDASFSVSIPLWFDSNMNRTAATFRRQPGFNSTLVRFKPRESRYFSTDAPVSIPLWFDSNLSPLNNACSSTSFQFHSGSIQTYNTFVFVCQDAIVSIPLWFDSN